LSLDNRADGLNEWCQAGHEWLGGGAVELVDARKLDVLEVSGLGGIAVDLPGGRDGVAHVRIAEWSVRSLLCSIFQLRSPSTKKSSASNV